MIRKALLVLGLSALMDFPGKTYGLANEATAAAGRSAAHWKRKTAMAIGQPDLATGDDEALETAHDKHMQVMNEMAAMPDDTGAANEKEKAAAAAAAGAENQTELANEELATARKENADMLIANALEAGRILPAEKAGWEQKFAEDHAGTKTALANEKTVKMKVTAKTKDLGNASVGEIANESDRREKLHDLVNETMKTDSLDYDRAFTKVQRDPKNKSLFEAMKKPADKK